MQGKYRKHGAAPQTGLDGSGPVETTWLVGGETGRQENHVRVHGSIVKPQHCVVQSPVNPLSEIRPLTTRLLLSALLNDHQTSASLPAITTVCCLHAALLFCLICLSHHHRFSPAALIHWTWASNQKVHGPARQTFPETVQPWPFCTSHDELSDWIN